MNRCAFVRGPLLTCVFLFAMAAVDARAAVDVEFRPATQSVVNNQVAEVELYVVSDSASNQPVGRLQVIFTWDPTKLKPIGVLEDGPYDWFSLGFPSNVVNSPVTGGVPANDGAAMVAALAQFDPNPVAQATPSGLLVGTLRFQAIDTGTNIPVSIEASLSGINTAVYEAPDGQVDVTGVLGPDVLVTVICNVNMDCDDGNDCTTDTCGGQVCSHTDVAAGIACGDPTDTDCDNPDTCDGAGTCQDNLESTGTACGSPSNTECDNPDTCNGAGVCLPNYEAGGTACGSSSDTECDNPDTCNGSGSCQSNFEASGTACGDPTDTDCDNPDTCNGSGTCQQNLASAGTACGDGSNTACTDPDTCDGGGTCLDNDFNCSQPTPFCKDDGEGSPICVECLFGDNTPCDDGNPCTADFCDLTNICRNSSDPNDGLPCPDSEFCNGSEVCQGGTCQALSDPCDDDNPCTDDVCNEGNDSCMNNPDDTNNPDDGLFCNGTDTCVSGKIIPGTPPDCDDMNVCTDDSCSDAMGACVHTNNTENCDDEDPCTIGDSCAGGVCVPGPRPTGNGAVDLRWMPLNTTVQVGDPILIGLYAVSVAPPTDEMFSIDVILSWDPTIMALEGVVNNSPYNWLLSFLPPEQPLNATFDDGDAAYAALSQLGNPAIATASPGLLITTFEFTALDLTGGTQVVIDDCESENGSVTRVDGGTAGLLQGVLQAANITIVECFTPDACDDGIFCNGEELCVANTCQPGELACDDGNICTDDVCSEAAQACQTIPLTGDFDQDGIYCNGVDRCEGGVFVPGTEIDCNDGNRCTDESCNENLDMCVYVNNSDNCDDGDLCTNGDTCMAGTCTGNPIPGCEPCDFDTDCDDGVSCTVDDCDDILGVCVFIPDDGQCPQDGVFCNGEEVCLGAETGDPVTGCGSLGPPCADCDEELGCGCDTPMVTSAGSRYLQVLPSEGQNPVALVVTTCGGTNPQYVGAWPGQSGLLPVDLTGNTVIDGNAGMLVDDPADALWLTPAEWDVVWVTGKYMIPNRTYNVQADCGAPGDPNLTLAAPASTWIHGDTNGIGGANFADVQFAVQGFQGLFVEGNTRVRSDLAGCTPNQIVNFADIQFAVQGFQQTPPFSLACPDSSNCQ